MPEFKFSYSISVQFEFTGEDLAILFKCSRSHYDGLCKSASHCGGFLWGYINGIQMRRSSQDLEEGRKYTPIENPDEAINLPDFKTLKNIEYLDQRHIDTMMKICELSHLKGVDAAPLSARLLRAFKAIGAESERLNG